MENTSDDKKKLLREFAYGAGISFFFGMTGYFLMFFFKLFASRYFGPKEYGTFEMINTLISFAMVFAMIGISGGISRFIPMYKHSGKFNLLSGYIEFIFKIPFLISCFIGFLFFVFSNQITGFFNFPNEMSQFIKIVSFFIPIKTISQIIKNIFVAEKKIFYRSFSAEFLDRIILIFGLIIIYIFNLSLFSAILTLVFSILGPFLFELFFYFNKISFPKENSSEKKNKEWFLFSVPLFFSGFFGFFVHWSNNLIIGKILDAKELGIYAIAFSLGSFLAFFQLMFSTIFLPLISECYANKNKEKIIFLFKKAASWTFGLSFLVFLCFLLYGEDILNILYGKEYVSGYWPLVISALGYLIFVSIGLNESLLVLYKETKFTFKISFISAMINIIFGIILIYYFGIIGAAMASTISLSLRGFLALLKIKKIISLEFNNIQNLKIFSSGVISACILFSLKNYLDISMNIFTLIILPFCLIFIYLLFLFIFKSFDNEDKIIFCLFKDKIVKIFSFKKQKK